VYIYAHIYIYVNVVNMWLCQLVVVNIIAFIFIRRHLTKSFGGIFNYSRCDLLFINERKLLTFLAYIEN
jgi:hypothetical protein